MSHRALRGAIVSLVGAAHAAVTGAQRSRRLRPPAEGRRRGCSTRALPASVAAGPRGDGSGSLQPLTHLVSSLLLASQAQLQRIDLAYHDKCVDWLAALNACRRETMWAPWECTHLRHTYEKCQYTECVCRAARSGAHSLLPGRSAAAHSLRRLLPPPPSRTHSRHLLLPSPRPARYCKRLKEPPAHH